MAPPDTNLNSLLPPAPTPARPALPRTGGSFGVPGTVEFPMFTDPEDDAMTAFGSKVESDLDLDLLDARVSHVRDAQYEPVSYPPDVYPVISVTAPVTRMREHAWRRPALVFLVVFAVSVLAGFAGVFLLTR